MRIAAWNLNNRVGKVRFRPEAALAAISLDVDVLVLNEYYPQKHHELFTSTLANAGWRYQEYSAESVEKANRVLIASRVSLEPLKIDLPSFDRQFPSNIACVHVPSFGISVVGVRVPWYEGPDIGLVSSAWDWIQSTAVKLADKPAIFTGDFNASLKSGKARGGGHFRRLIESGLERAAPHGKASFFGKKESQSEVDHILGNMHCELTDAQYVVQSGHYCLAGKPDAISDHAAILAKVKRRDFVNQ